MIKEEVNMADEKQAKVSISGGEEIPMDTEEIQKKPVDRTLRRTISAPMDGSNDLNNDSVFSPVNFHSSFPRKNSLNGGLVETTTPDEPGGGTQQKKRMRPKRTSSCRSSSISDDDQGLQLSPLLKGQRPRTYSDSLNVDCSSTCPSPVSFFYFFTFLNL